MGRLLLLAMPRAYRMAFHVVAKGGRLCYKAEEGMRITAV